MNWDEPTSPQIRLYWSRDVLYVNVNQDAGTVGLLSPGGKLLVHGQAVREAVSKALMQLVEANPFFVNSGSRAVTLSLTGGATIEISATDAGCLEIRAGGPVQGAFALLDSQGKVVAQGAAVREALRQCVDSYDDESDVFLFAVAEGGQGSETSAAQDFLWLEDHLVSFATWATEVHEALKNAGPHFAALAKQADQQAIACATAATKLQGQLGLGIEEDAF